MGNRIHKELKLCSYYKRTAERIPTSSPPAALAQHAGRARERSRRPRRPMPGDGRRRADDGLAGERARAISRARSRLRGAPRGGAEGTVTPRGGPPRRPRNPPAWGPGGERPEPRILRVQPLALSPWTPSGCHTAPSLSRRGMRLYRSPSPRMQRKDEPVQRRGRHVEAVVRVRPRWPGRESEKPSAYVTRGCSIVPNPEARRQMLGARATSVGAFPARAQRDAPPASLIAHGRSKC